MKTNEQLKIFHTQELSIGHTGNRVIKVHQGVEITREAIEAGFLKNLSGSQLSVLLYIFTHIEQNFTLMTSCTKISSLVNDTPTQVEKTLRQLEGQGYLKLEDAGHTDLLNITLLKIPGSADTETSEETNYGITFSLPTKSLPDRTDETVAYVLKQKVFSEEDLVRAINALIPPHLLTPNFRQEIEFWFKTFDKDVIKELIRRTDEARQRELEFNCQAYMRKIVKDWENAQIYTLPDLNSADQIFRESRSLIEEFGIDRQKEMTRTHWETIHKWINAASEDDFALSIEVARFAIQEAIRRKSDGRPSLDYIENNFIKPWKESRVKTVEEARELLLRKKIDESNQPTEKTPQPAKSENKNKWQVGSDFTRFREN